MMYIHGVLFLHTNTYIAGLALPAGHQPRTFSFGILRSAQTLAELFTFFLFIYNCIIDDSYELGRKLKFVPVINLLISKPS